MNAPKAANPAVQLLEFQRKLQRCKSARELAFVAANESFDVLLFDQAVVWQYGLNSAISITAVSGLAEVPPDTPYSQWLVRAIEFIRSSKPEAVAAFAYADLPGRLAEDGREWVHEHLMHCLLRSPDGEAIGGMLFHRAEPFGETERAAAGWMAEAVGFGFWAWRRESRNLRRLLQQKNLRYAAGGAVALLALLAFIPVHLSALAPAEITPVKPIPITSPVDGVVGRIVVQPNQEVKADQLLVELDDTSVRNKLAVAQKALDTARADYQRAANKAFADEASKGELLVLDSRAREKAAEVQYLGELLDRLRLTAPQGGIAIFADSEDWRGKPVQPGEKIMIIADPSLVGITVYLPPEDAVQLDIGGDVTVFLNVDPLSPLHGKIVQTSYEPTAQPDNTLAYVVRASLAPESGLPRIGLRGTAKVTGERVSLGYFLLRKPILYARKSLGM